MNRTLSMRDKKEMRRMGYELRAFFINPHGVPFHKDFMTEPGMMDFIRKAREVGTEFVGYVSI